MYNRKRKIIKIILIILSLIAIGLGVIYYLLNKYKITTVYVEGNIHYTEDQIKELVMEGPLGDNSLYLSFKYKDKSVEEIPFVDDVDVTILQSDTIRITVYEKALAGYVKYLDTYMYFDKDGYVVESSSVKTEGIPQVTGFSFDYIVLGEQLPLEDTGVFNTVLILTQLLNKYELNADKIFFNSSLDATLYFGDVKVALGNDINNVEDKIKLLPEFIEKLQGRAGTLEMEEYGTEYTFKPDKE